MQQSGNHEQTIMHVGEITPAHVDSFITSELYRDTLWQLVHTYNSTRCLEDVY